MNLLHFLTCFLLAKEDVLSRYCRVNACFYEQGDACYAEQGQELRRALAAESYATKIVSISESKCSMRLKYASMSTLSSFMQLLDKTASDKASNLSKRSKVYIYREQGPPF